MIGRLDQLAAVCQLAELTVNDSPLEVLTVHTESDVAALTPLCVSELVENERSVPSEQVAVIVLDSNVDGTVQVTDEPESVKLSDPITSPDPLNDVGVGAAEVEVLVSGTGVLVSVVLVSVDGAVVSAGVVVDSVGCGAPGIVIDGSVEASSVALLGTSGAPGTGTLGSVTALSVPG